MIAFIIGVLVIIGSSIGIMHVFFPAATSFTPGRRTRGLARWWCRCTRWTHRLRAAPRKPAQSTLQPVPWVMSHEQIITARQMQRIGQVMRGSTLTLEPIKLLDISIQDLADLEED